LESFQPLYSFNFRKDEWIMIMARFFCAILLGAAVYQLSQTHSLSDIGNFTSQQFLDVLEWGQKKLADPPRSHSQIPPLSSLVGDSPHSPDDPPLPEKDPNAPGNVQVEDFSCLLECGYDSYEDLDNHCGQRCVCIKDVWMNKCVSRCNPPTLEAIRELYRAVCGEEPPPFESKKTEL